MSEWREVTLGALADEAGGFVKTGPFGSQLHANEYVDDWEGVPVVMPRDMTGGRVDRATVSRVAEATAQRLSHHRLAPGDVVLARRGDIGRLAFIAPDEAGWLCGTGCLRVHVPSAEAVHPPFLRHLMGSNGVAEWLAGQAVGATMPNLNAGIVESLPLSVPPVVTQRSIAAVLAAFDDLIEINEHRIAVLEDLARSFYHEWFLRWPGTNRADGSIPLSELAKVVVDGVDPDTVDANAVYVGLEHLPRRSTTLKDWGDVGGITSRKLKFKEGDTLFGKIRPYFHKVSWAPSEGVASSDTIVLRSRKDGIHAALVNSIASSDAFVATAVATSNGTKMPRADVATLLDYQIPRLGPSALAEFERSARPFVEDAAQCAAHNRALAATRDLLLPRLVTGRLDIEDVDLGDLLSEPEAVA